MFEVNGELTIESGLKKPELSLVGWVLDWIGLD